MPKPGKWLVKADFEDFELYVNPESTGIPRLVFPGVEVKTNDELGIPDHRRPIQDVPELDPAGGQVRSKRYVGLWNLCVNEGRLGNLDGCTG